jgi:hypothetical protein
MSASMNAENNDTESVKAHWLKDELPGINCLVHGNGMLTMLNIYAVSTPEGKKHYVFPVADTTISSIEHYNDDVWTEIQIHPNHITTNGIKLVCGEGGMGNEGFIAAIDQESDGLVWALFSTESNPFVKLELYNNTLFGYSDRLLYKLDLNEPTKIEIEEVGHTNP